MGQDTDELTRGIEETRENLSREVDELTDKISPARIAHRQKEAATSKLRGIRDQVMGVAHDGTDQVTGAASNATDAASDALHSVGAKARGNPLGAGLVAFGAGLVISALIPPSKVEVEAARQAMDAGAPLLEEAKAVGQDAADQLKETATQALGDLKDTAQEAVAHVQDEAKSSAENVKDAAPST